MPGDGDRLDPFAAVLVGREVVEPQGGVLGRIGGADQDRLAQMLRANTAAASPVLSRVLAAAWRAALTAVAEGSEPQQARAALLAFAFRIPS